ncbi:MAG: chemotaxis protein CheW [Sideroxydans sp.]|nr:chemotaxis protein CheW [Sideroxydans sp.]
MANRINLREFQQALTARITNSASAQQQISTLGVMIAGQHYVLDMADISEVLERSRATAIPLSQPWVVGMTNVRGVLYCISDIAAYLKLGKASGNSDNRLLLVAERFGFNAALLVDSVLGLRDVQTFTAQQDHYLDAQQLVWRKLDVAGLLQQSEFLQIGA